MLVVQYNKDYSKGKSKEAARINLKATDSKDFLDIINFEILYLCLLIY